MGTAVDILLQMSTDSPFQAAFLESCSTEAFFRTAAMVIRTPVSDARIMERLSIILQKLSKIKLVVILFMSEICAVYFLFHLNSLKINILC